LRKPLPKSGLLLATLALFLASCGQAISTSVPGEPTAGTDIAQPTEEPEYRWSQLLRRDDIYPIYDPKFVSAEEAEYSDVEVVMGIAIDGEAKAYPIGVLNSREW
jgi:hypothetical protein